MRVFTFLVVSLIFNSGLFSQTTNLTVDWMNAQNFVMQSDTIISECSNLTVSLITPNLHRRYSGSLYPNTAGTRAGFGPLIYNVEFQFSSPVSNVRLRLVDVDRDARNTSQTIDPDLTLHGEKLINFIPSVPIATGGLSTVGNEVHAQSDDSEGWLTWSDSNVTSVSFDVERYLNAYGIIIVEVEFESSDCPTEDCSCEDILKELQEIKEQLKDVKGYWKKRTEIDEKLLKRKALPVKPGSERLN